MPCRLILLSVKNSIPVLFPSLLEFGPAVTVVVEEKFMSLTDV